MREPRKPPSGPSGETPSSDPAAHVDPVAGLAVAWPRALIAAGMGEALATWWVEARDAAIEASKPEYPHIPVDDALLSTIFEARRSRRLVRGFEAIESSLAAQEAGMRRAPATRAQGERRISRLLLLTSDGALRLYRNSTTLQRRYQERLEIVVLECDEVVLGEALYGEGQRVRAVLLDHKEAVLNFLVEVAVTRAGATLPDEASEPGQPGS